MTVPVNLVKDLFATMASEFGDADLDLEDTPENREFATKVLGREPRICMDKLCLDYWSVANYLSEQVTKVELDG